MTYLRHSNRTHWHRKSKVISALYFRFKLAVRWCLLFASDKPETLLVRQPRRTLEPFHTFVDPRTVVLPIGEHFKIEPLIERGQTQDQIRHDKHTRGPSGLST